MAPHWCHMFYKGLKKEKHDKIFLSETIRPRDLIFGMYHDLVDLYPVCSNYAPGAKIDPTPGVTRDMGSFQQVQLYVSVKQNSGERFRATLPSLFN